ncbi:CbiX/SirB N-terminal domain-containing protein [Caloranaerobacter ferrireducens]|uniref:CbiX/SirB N-terminal domain-containing protein n=1 Tax=Caloranaerobacter ferrireducens TaxID=1323370 RepID=UPI00084DBA37|nr:CbiX/SirB N-terminal domain-containing protein [Caloranaerobacter ferrireducens]
MSGINSLNKLLFYIIMFIFFSVLFFVYDNTLENIFLLLSFIGFINILEQRRIFRSKKNIFLLISIVLITYTLSIAFLFTQRYDMKINSLKTYRRNEDKAVLLVVEGESPVYKPSKAITNILLNESFLSKMSMPYQLYNIKKNYHLIGKSDYKRNVQKLVEKLKEELPEEYYVNIAYLKDTEYIEEKIFDSVAKGYYKIIIVPIIVSEGSEFTGLKKRIEKLRLYNYNVQIRWTEPFWNSEYLAISYISKISNNIDAKKIKDTGIVLIGQGESNKSNLIKSIKQQIMFSKKVKTYLVEELGLDETKIKIAWFDKLKPDYVQAVKEVLEYGVGEVLCVYLKPTTTNIDNNIIANKIKRKIDFPEGIKIKVIDGFCNDENIIKEIRNRIRLADMKVWN